MTTKLLLTRYIDLRSFYSVLTLFAFTPLFFYIEIPLSSPYLKGLLIPKLLHLKILHSEGLHSRKFLRERTSLLIFTKKIGHEL